jgi:hypothetical protein
MDETQNLTFGQALQALQEGHAVTRAIWGGYWKMEKARFTESNAPNLVIPIAYTKYGSVEPAQPYWQDMLAGDWRVLTAQEVSLLNQRIAVQANGVHKGVYYASTPNGPVHANEHDASRNLDVRGYAGKWAKAKVYAKGLFPDVTSALHWDAVRLHFLELGGEWLGASAAGEVTSARAEVMGAVTNQSEQGMYGLPRQG